MIQKESNTGIRLKEIKTIEAYENSTFLVVCKLNESDADCISIFDAESKSMSEPVYFRDIKQLDCIAFENTKSIIAIAVNECIFIATYYGQIIRTLKGHTNEVKNLIFSSDGTKLISADTKSIRIWNAENWECINMSDRYEDIYLKKITSDCRFLYGYKDDKLVKWDLQTFEEVATFDFFAEERELNKEIEVSNDLSYFNPPNHSYSISDFELSKDNKLIIINWCEWIEDFAWGYIKMYDTENFNVCAKLSPINVKENEAEYFSTFDGLYISKDNKLLASNGYAIYIWSLSHFELIETIPIQYHPKNYKKDDDEHLFYEEERASGFRTYPSKDKLRISNNNKYLLFHLSYSISFDDLPQGRVDNTLVCINTDMEQHNVEGVPLDMDNKQFFDAAKLVLETKKKVIYLTGKAGTGKSTFLKYIRKEFKGNMAVLAPTGVAAINVGGQTIHSFFKIKPSIYFPHDRRLRKKANQEDEDKSTIYDHFEYTAKRLLIIKSLELLIIDEISMVRCDLLDVVDRLLRVYRKRESEPFGGVQVVLIGDTFQLPPVAKRDEWEILEKFYDSEFFFSSKVIQSNKPFYIELKKIYRQKEEEFIDLLNKVRINKVGQDEMDLLNSKYNPTFSPDINSNYIILATHNKIANNTNLTKLSELKTDLQQFEAIISGVFPKDTPTDKVLKLKEGAQIMFVKNDPGKRYHNGTIGKINKIDGNEIIVCFENGKEIIVEKQEWENIQYTWNEELKKIEEVVIGTFTQFPIKLAWAISVHKSQGKTFEKVIADLGNAFASGQVYVALSRCTTLNGLILKSPITRNAIITDSRVIEFSKTETPETVIIEEFEKGKADKIYKKCREAFDNNSSDEMLQYLDEAIMVRDDRDTPKFKQYIRIKINLFHRYREQLSTSLKKIQKFEEQIEKINEFKEKESSLKKDFFSQRLTVEQFKQRNNCQHLGVIKRSNGGFFLAKTNANGDAIEFYPAGSPRAGQVVSLGAVHSNTDEDVQALEMPVVGLTNNGDWILYNKGDEIAAFIDTLLLRLKEFELEINRLNADKIQLLQQVEETNQDKNDLNNTINKLNNTIKMNESIIIASQNYYSQLKSELAKKDILLKNKDEENRELTQLILDWSNAYSYMQNEVHRVQAITWWQKLWSKK